MGLNRVRVDNTQMALCDVYEQLIAVTSAADKEA